MNKIIYNLIIALFFLQFQEIGYNIENILKIIMKNQLKKLREFHSTYGAFYSENPTLNVPEETKELRKKLMQEELREVTEAMAENDLKSISKELSDLLYVVYGTIEAYGLSEVIEDIFDEVHASNMSKLGEDGKPIYREDGKILKGPNYFEPDLKKFFKT